MNQFAVRDLYESMDDEAMPIFETYDDASEFIDSHPQNLDGEGTKFEILTRTVSEWIPA